MTYFGKWLQETRTKAGMSARELSNVMGMSKSYITDIETGYRLPSDDRLIDIARIFKVHSAYLFAMCGKVHPKVQDYLRKNPVHGLRIYHNVVQGDGQ